MFKRALPKPYDGRDQFNAIKGLLAFAWEDGELFSNLVQSGIKDFDPVAPIPAKCQIVDGILENK